MKTGHLTAIKILEKMQKKNVLFGLVNLNIIKLVTIQQYAMIAIFPR